MGLQWLFITLLLVGVLQIAAGVFRLGKFVRLIPHPVMMGFVNGLAIVIFLSQLELFKERIHGSMQWLPVGELSIMLGLVALTMGIMHILPKITTKIPAALTAIVIVSGLVIIADMDVKTVGSFIREEAVKDSGISTQFSNSDIQSAPHLGRSLGIDYFYGVPISCRGPDRIVDDAQLNR